MNGSDFFLFRLEWTGLGLPFSRLRPTAYGGQPFLSSHRNPLCLRRVTREERETSGRRNGIRCVRITAKCEVEKRVILPLAPPNSGSGRLLPLVTRPTLRRDENSHSKVARLEADEFALSYFTHFTGPSVAIVSPVLAEMITTAISTGETQRPRHDILFFPRFPAENAQVIHSTPVGRSIK